MKKLIAILTIAIVLVGAVFATDPDASITITANVASQTPSFKMSITSDTTITGAAVVYTDPTVVAGGSATATSALASGSVTTLLGASGSLSVAFSLQQVAPARLTGTGASYKLKVEATDLILQGTNGDVASPTTQQKFGVVDDTPDVTRASETLTTTVNSNAVTVANLSHSGNELTVVYNGFVDASTTAPKNLGTFSVSWNANQSAVPGDYKATIKLFVSAT